MNKISKVSKFIKALLLFIGGLQLSVYLILFLFGSTTGSVSEVSLNYLGISSSFNVVFSGSWHDIAQALVEEGFNAIVILGSVESIPYLLIYYFLYQLFSLYQQGLIFTEKNINYIKKVGLVLFCLDRNEYFLPSAGGIGFALLGSF